MKGPAKQEGQGSRRWTANTTPGQSIRRFCLECVGSFHEVKTCGGDKCLGGQGDEHGRCRFYAYRLGKGRPSLKLIRRMCLECMGGSSQFVAQCGAQDCPVHQYRFGRRHEGSEVLKSFPRRGLEEGLSAPRIDEATSTGTEVALGSRSSIVRAETPATVMEELTRHEI